MKHHKELRWLLFLLIPLIVLFALHLFIPLIIKKTNHSLSQQNYKYDLVSAQKTSIISNHFNNFRTVSFTMGAYFNQLLAVLDLYDKQPTAFLNTTVNSIYNINAYLFAKEIDGSSSPKSTELNGSMWFSTNADSTSQLSSNLRDLFDHYLSVEPFIETMVFARKQGLVSSVCFYMVRDNESIYAQYPIQYKNRFLGISAPALDSLYQQAVKTSQLNKYETAASFYEVEEHSNRTLLVFCRPSFSGSISIVACLKLNLFLLGRDLSQQIRVGQGLYFSSAMSLLLSNDILHSSNENPQILLQFDDPEMNSFIIPSNVYFDVQGNGLDPTVFNSVINLLNRRLYVLQQNQTIWYVSPVRDINNRSAVLHLVTRSEIGSTQLLPEGLKSNLNVIIIPVSLLAIVFTIINCLIMKRLLESVDKQLFSLDERCKFIADGDINVEIPKYNKSKDMREIYTRVNIISKLHRYCDNNYFSGHFSDKILKYNEALQLIRSLGYDPGNLLENIGEAYNYLNEWSHSTKYLKESVEAILLQIQQEYGPMDSILSHKLRKSSLPLKYREMELILIRRLFKLNYAYIRYFEMSQGNLNEDVSGKLKVRLQKKREKYTQQFTQYIDLFKKAIYPNLAKFAEGIIILFFEVKHSLLSKKLTEVRMQERKAIQLLQIYKNNYTRVSKLLKQRKGSSHKLFFMSNKLTDYSRSNPSLLMIIQNLIRAKVEQACNPVSSKYIHKVDWLTEALATPIFFIGTSYLVMKQLRRVLINLNINVEPLESTKIFKQNIPFKTLHAEDVTPVQEAHLLRMATKESKGLQKQFLLMFDCQRNLGKEQKEQIDGCDYLHHEADHLFTKLIKGCDRVSIIKFNTKEGIKVECGLVLKESNETVLKKEIDEAISERNSQKSIQNDLLEAVNKAICRIKHLCCEKVIIMFFRNISHYILHSQKSRKKRRSTKRSSIKSMLSSEGNELEFDDFGGYLVNWLQDPNIRNLIFILYCAKGDSIEKFREYFGLKDINRRIWASTSGLNLHNKAVFIIQQKHKTDVDRILMLKALDIPDNNVFVL